MRFLLKIVMLWATLAAITAAPAYAQSLVAGKDFHLITPPQPTPPGKNVEVLEFFWYGCSHCANLQPSLVEWLKKKPADVAFRSQPAAFDENWTQLARTFYAIEVVAAQHQLHHQLFDAIHKTKKLNPAALVKDPKSLFEWVGTQQVDVKKFTEAYQSFSVVSKARRTVDTTLAYGVSGTPALAIDGRFLIAPSMAPLKADNKIDYERYFRNVDQLIAMARANRTGK